MATIRVDRPSGLLVAVMAADGRWTGRWQKLGPGICRDVPEALLADEGFVRMGKAGWWVPVADSTPDEPTATPINDGEGRQRLQADYVETGTRVTTAADMAAARVRGLSALKPPARFAPAEKPAKRARSR